MVLGTIVSSVVGGGLSLFNANEQRNAQNRAIEEANELALERAEAEYERALLINEINYQDSVTEYLAAQAATEQFRANELQIANDQAYRSLRIMEAASMDFALGSQALYDQFVTGEALRFQQEGIQYQQRMANYSTQAAQAQAQIGALNARIQGFGIQQQIVAAEADKQVANYISQIAQNGIRQQEIIGAVQGKTQEVASFLATREAQGNFEFMSGVIAGAIAGGREGARAVTRSGGGQTAKLVMEDRLKLAMRDYAKVHMDRRLRSAQMADLNYQIQNVEAKKLARLAEASNNAAGQAEATVKIAGLQQQRIGTQIAGAQAQIQGAQAAMANAKVQAGLQQQLYNNVIMPSFGLAQRQYQREMTGLLFNTNQTLLEASIPYRQQEVFDPLRPIKGLEPEYYAPTLQQTQPLGTFGALNAFFQGAQSFSGGGFGRAIGDAFLNIIA